MLILFFTSWNRFILEFINLEWNELHNFFAVFIFFSQTLIGTSDIKTVGSFAKLTFYFWLSKKTEIQVLMPVNLISQNNYWNLNLE